jgi:epoxyqueuosine reductase
VGSSATREQLIRKAHELGADAAGVASLELLKRSPSHLLLSRFGTKIDGAYSYDAASDLLEILWPDEARSALVIAVRHPREEPALDWSGPSGDTPGNRVLMRAGKELVSWSEAESGIGARAMPYWVEEGGIYLKDAAMLAGLGCVGRNNLLITPEWGPRVRLRALLLDAELTSTGPSAFDPCRRCEAPCRSACPQDAFDRTTITAREAGIPALPARDGTFSRSRCFLQMEQDHNESGVEVEEEFLSESSAERAADSTSIDDQGSIKWCRRCEFACPIGA